MKKRIHFCLGLALGSVLMFAAGFSAYKINIHSERLRNLSALVEHGHAEYYLDENNERQWRMKECGE